MSDELSPDPQGAVKRVPRTAEERQQLLSARQGGWEHLLFAGRLLERHSDLRLARRDHELGLASGPFLQVDADEAVDFVQACFSQITWTTRELSRALAGQEAAFGRPGEPGDVELIEHLADVLIRVEKRLLDWADQVRCAGVPSEFETTMELVSRVGDECLAAISSFVDKAVEQTDALPDSLRSRSDGDEPLKVVSNLELTVDDDLLEEVLASLREAVGAHRASLDVD